jgi:hypothetical protein
VLSLKGQAEENRERRFQSPDSARASTLFRREKHSHQSLLR